MPVEAREQRHRDHHGRADENAENTDDSIRVAPTETADGHSETRTTQEVRQGHTGDHVRYILMASIAGAVFVLMIVAAYFYA